MKKFLTFDELKEHGVRLGRRQLDRLMKEGKFPNKVRLSEHRIAWLASEIKAHVDAQVKARK